MEEAAFLATVHIGDVLLGTVAEVARSRVALTLDAFPGTPLGRIGSLDLSWRSFHAFELRLGDRVAAEVIAVDPARREVLLSRSATENPELWAFLKALRPGRLLTGTVAAIERFGVFVDLDEGPRHPTFPGVGFITIPELSWRWFTDTSEIVAIGERVTCEFLQFDTTNGEARLSLRATEPNPFQQFAETVHPGQVLRGPVTKLVPFGVFVRVADGIEGLIHRNDLSVALEAIQVGDEVTVTILEIDAPRRRVVLSHRL